MSHDPMRKSDYEVDLPKYVGMTLADAKKQIKEDKHTHTVVWRDGKWSNEIRIAVLRPNEVNLVVEDGKVKRAYRIR